eukprot:TRINITY_DN1236_c0_g1_i1.p1 TRINITY_DN1236_c0_g1~~TRINITY_DN1236_c0_g1_i1.p1  ORF type:complete len:172 (-),score=40.61 TRINITY_DN1236_c0_g1_i1:144-608(-)
MADNIEEETNIHIQIENNINNETKQTFSSSSSQSIALEVPSIKQHFHIESFLDNSIYYQVIVLRDSYYVWIGSKAATMDELAVAITTPYDKIPSASSLLGQNVDGLSQGLATRLATRTKKVFFVSCNLPNDQIMIAFAEKKLVEFLKSVNVIQS